MNFYQIKLKSVPDFNNDSYDQTVKMNDQQIYGVIAAGTSALGDVRDQYFTVYDQGGKRLDLDNVLDQTGSVVFEGEPAFDLVPEYENGMEKSWLKTIADTGNFYGEDGTVTKRFTVKAFGPDGMYLFQFDDQDFLRGMFALINALNVNPQDALVYYHKGDVPMQIK